MTTVVADLHVHIYPFHDSRRALESAVRNLSARAREAGLPDESFRPACFLTERADCDFFARLAHGEVALPAGWVIETKSPGLVMLRAAGGEKLLVVAGRQIATIERLEVLALATESTFRDGEPLEMSIEAARTSGARVVMPWSPGKWIGKRGVLLAAVLERYGRETLTLADCALRPRLWPMPPLLRAAESKGFSLAAGTDPLPLRGEESRIGEYCSIFSSDGVERLEQVQTALRSAKFRTTGKRLPVAEVGSRLLRLKRERV